SIRWARRLPWVPADLMPVVVHRAGCGPVYGICRAFAILRAFVCPAGRARASFRDAVGGWRWLHLASLRRGASASGCSPGFAIVRRRPKTAEAASLPYGWPQEVRA